MASRRVAAAVKARLAAHWSRCEVVYPNDRLQAPAKRPYLVVEYPIANEEPASLGGLAFSETGALRLVLCFDRGSGSDTAGAWADELAALFRAKTFDGVSTDAVSPPRFDEDTEARWALIVPYRFDFDA